jgi:hypothetical protein
MTHGAWSGGRLIKERQTFRDATQRHILWGLLTEVAEGPALSSLSQRTGDHLKFSMVHESKFAGNYRKDGGDHHWLLSHLSCQLMKCYAATDIHGL